MNSLIHLSKDLVERQTDRHISRLSEPVTFCSSTNKGEVIVVPHIRSGRVYVRCHYVFHATSLSLGIGEFHRKPSRSAGGGEKGEGGRGRAVGAPVTGERLQAPQGGVLKGLAGASAGEARKAL